MKIKDHFLQNCLYWLTEISLYTKRINQMQKELETEKSKLLHNEMSDNFEHLMNRFHVVLDKLKGIESSIIYLIKDNSGNASNAGVTSKCNLDSEKELFEQMKSGYSSFIELQRSCNYFYTQMESIKSAPKVIELLSSKRIETKLEANINNAPIKLTQHA